MNTLFPVAPLYPEGLMYTEIFFSPAKEEVLCEAIEQTSLHAFHFQGYEAKRKVASFGYDCSFEKRSLTKGKAIPEAFLFLAEKVAKQLSIAPNDFAELLVSEYPAGSVIN